MYTITVDWIKEGQRILPELGPTEFTHDAIASRLGMSASSLRTRSRTLVELNECFSYRHSHQRWAEYHKEDILKVALECTTGVQLEQELKQRYSLTFNSDKLGEFLKGTAYRLSKTRDRLIIKSYKIDTLTKSYLVGYFLGDGSYHGAYVSWYTTTPDWLSRFAGLPNFVFSKYRDGYFCELRCQDTELKSEFLAMGIPERKTYADFRLNQLESLDKVEFLAGWIDSDGWLADDGSRYCITTSSLELANQVVEMLGVDAYLRKPKQEKNCLMQTIALSKRLSYVISRESKYLIKRVDDNEFQYKQSKVRKKDWDTRDCLRYISTRDGMFLREWGANT